MKLTYQMIQETLNEPEFAARLNDLSHGRRYQFYEDLVCRLKEKDPELSFKLLTLQEMVADLRQNKITRGIIWETLLDHPDGRYTLDQIKIWINAKFLMCPSSHRLGKILNEMGFGRTPRSYKEYNQRSGDLYICYVHKRLAGP